MPTIALFLALIPAQVASATHEPPPWCLSEVMERMDEASTVLAHAHVGTTAVGGDNAVLAVSRPGDPIRLVTVRNGVSRDPEFLVEIVRRNGVNSHYRVNAGEGWVVLGIRTNVHDRRRPGRSHAVTYHPFSPDILEQSLVLEGRRYLEWLIEKASQGLDTAGVASRAQEDVAVTDVVPRDVLLTLLVIEHITPDELDREGVTWVVEKTLATLGMNRSVTFDFARSRAGALGLAQFIRSTYATVRRAYPKALLIHDFTRGMTDHVNAVTAQACLADRSLAILDPSEQAELLACGEEEAFGAFLAASYNGGESRARNAYRYDRDTWEKEGSGLLPETVTYVRVFHAVYRELFLN